MINDVIFNVDEKSAYYDWGIVLTKADIPLPKPKVTTVDIMGADGVIDLSEVLTGDIKYDERQIKLNFELMDDTRYSDLITEISNYLHGKNITFTLTNDEDFYYRGRAYINSWECSRRKGKIVITVDCEPYKMELNETVIRIPLSSTPVYYNLTNLRKIVCPVIDVSDNASVVFNGNTYSLTSGAQQIVDIQLVEGDNIISVSGTGTITFTYRRGAL